MRQCQPHRARRRPGTTERSTAIGDTWRTETGKLGCPSKPVSRASARRALVGELRQAGGWESNPHKRTARRDLPVSDSRHRRRRNLTIRRRNWHGRTGHPNGWVPWRGALPPLVRGCPSCSGRLHGPSEQPGVFLSSRHKLDDSTEGAQSGLCFACPAVRKQPSDALARLGLDERYRVRRPGAGPFGYPTSIAGSFRT